MTTRGSELRGWFSDLGHALDFKHHWIVKRHAESKALSRDLGVVKNYEQLLVGSCLPEPMNSVHS